MNVRNFLRKRLLFKKQKVDSTGYYGIEDPFPELILKIRRFMGGYGVPIVGCQESLVIKCRIMLRKLQFLEGS